MPKKFDKKRPLKCPEKLQKKPQKASIKALKPISPKNIYLI